MMKLSGLGRELLFKRHKQAKGRLNTGELRVRAEENTRMEYVEA